ncbi:LLM class flavin-dependent oxidoreductase [Conexibacter sp. CPCC 206217]|uniref:LLM class flavin-dependent oxidoreductase n=1 Tax=Conexibacter sp. CPCC 206217 TaxID=3064574 RepID=UPI002718A769|nr:LLM class flavin-dependent oxidoreductase [Conexibacter sp. CPCC 206217]MDO8212008.1 LLM class flavin-dependent oxidoreductase [Conexibacter sp. CPCC 206217]
MRAGVTLYFQNYGDWDRFEAAERGESVPGRPAVPDAQIWREDLRIGGLVEELGFDSLWTVEHHVSPYTMITNPLQLLAYFAGATERIDLGTMVVVLPWHHPLRVAEDLVLLQNVLGEGRRPIVGLGRGAGRREFKGLDMEMSESRTRFDEAVEVIKLALTEDRFSFKGEHWTFEDVELRPKPRDASEILENLFCAWGSPGTVPIAAQAGLKPMIIPQKGWDDYHAEMEQFATVRADSGYEPAQPILVMCTYCAETEEAARAGAERWMPEYGDSALRNYELAGDHFGRTRGYEHYAAQSSALRADRAAVGRVYVENHVWGTPEQCLAKIETLARQFHPGEFVFMMRYGGMPADAAERSMRLFAKEVLPGVHAIPVEAPLLYSAR